jgi:hypothetical protein
MLVRKKSWKLVGAVGRESGDLGGGGKGRHLSPFIPRSLYVEKKRLGRRRIVGVGFGFGADSVCFAYGLTA